MKVTQLLIVFMLGVSLTMPAVPAAQPAVPPAQPAVPPAQPVSLAADMAPQADLPDAPDNQNIETETIPQEIAGLPGVTEDWWQKVQAQILEDMYAFTLEESAEGGPPVYRGYNTAHNFEISLAAGNLRLAKSTGEAEEAGKQPGWSLELRTTGLGFEGHVRPAPPGETTAEGNRLDLGRAGLAEWYLNDENGLEQGFTIAAPPAGGGEQVMVEMSLETDLTPILVGGGAAIEFTQPGGNVVVLRYGELAAYDAAGQALAGHMELAGCAGGVGCTLRLVVEAGGAAYPLTINPQITTPAWSALGENANDFFGSAAASAGDVNNDGYDDLIIGATYGGYGKVYLYYGSVNGPGEGPDLNMTGEYLGDNFGHAVAPAGDVNGDSYDDFIVGAPGYYVTEPNQGKVYLYYGSPNGPSGGGNWTATGETNYRGGFGWSVASAGDLNGDGYGDLIVGAPSYYNNRGKVYVFRGAASGPVQTWYQDGAVTDGVKGDQYGFSVASAGDLNNDGFDDIVIGAPYFDDDPGGSNPFPDQGRVYVYPGRAAPPYVGGIIWAGRLFVTGANFGYSVAPAGDVNGDGYADLAVGAQGYDNLKGRVYVYHGAENYLGSSDRAADWSAAGEGGPDHFGYAVASAGDLNGDTYDDLVVGAPFYGNPDQGKAYVYHGSAGGLEGSAAWSATGEPNSNVGSAVAAAGDVNGDGFSDLLIGDSGYDDHRGKASLYQGTPWGLNPSYSFDWTAGGEQAANQFGYTLGAAGDVNGDGFSDLAVGAPAYDGQRGKAYVFPGTPAGLSLTPFWIASGAYAGDQFARSVATAGDVNKDGYDDLVVGAPGNDDNGTSAGRVYLFYGSHAGLASAPGWSSAGVNSRDRFGAAAATAGDVNDDGFSDLAIGADGYPGGDSNGKAYVYHGSADGPGAAAVWTASSAQPGARFGSAVGTAGDVNGDGCADLVVGAWANDSYRGVAYVYHGCSPVGLNTTPNWSQSGQDANNYFGYSVATAGDVNGDGYADLIVGAYGYDYNRGRVYVYWGTAAGLTPNCWSASGVSSGDAYASSVATAGDVNGDGYADVVVGAEGWSADAGAMFLYHGGSDGLGGINSPADWTALGARTSDHFGAAVGTAGDVNGDGFSDLVAAPARGHHKHESNPTPGERK